MLVLSCSYFSFLVLLEVGVSLVVHLGLGEGMFLMGGFLHLTKQQRNK